LGKDPNDNITVRTVVHARVPEVLHVDVRVLQPVDGANDVEAGAAVVSTDRAAAAVVAK
jgi:hypothetical protein